MQHNYRTIFELLFSQCLCTPLPALDPPSTINHVSHMRNCCVIVAKQLCKFHCKNRWLGDGLAKGCKGGFCNIIGVDLSVHLVDAFAHQSIPLAGPPSPIRYVSLPRVGFPSLRISPRLPNITERWLELCGPRYLWAISLTRFSGYIILT